MKLLGVIGGSEIIVLLLLVLLSFIEKKYRWESDENGNWEINIETNESNLVS